mgnify:CR=1 FL=1
MKKQTQSIRIQSPKSHHREHSVPLYLTSSFTFEDAEQSNAVFAEEMEGNIYSRFMNPNVDEFVSKMCVLENAEDGIAFSTGMAAIFASMAGLLKSGDHIVASNSLYGGTYNLLNVTLPRLGITTTSLLLEIAGSFTISPASIQRAHCSFSTRRTISPHAWLMRSHIACRPMNFGRYSLSSIICKPPLR